LLRFVHQHVAHIISPRHTPLSLNSTRTESSLWVNVGRAHSRGGGRVLRAKAGTGTTGCKPRCRRVGTFLHYNNHQHVAHIISPKNPPPSMNSTCTESSLGVFWGRGGQDIEGKGKDRHRDGSRKQPQQLHSSSKTGAKCGMHC